MILGLVLSFAGCGAHPPQNVRQLAHTPVVRAVLCNVVQRGAPAATQGLVIDTGRLYESTGGYGVSSVRRIDFQTGAITGVPWWLGRSVN